MFSGANHHFLCGDNNVVSKTAQRTNGVRINLRIATHTHPAMVVSMVDMKPNNLGLATAATHPDHRMNLLSVSELAKDKCVVQMNGSGGSHIKYSGGKTMPLVQEDGLYWAKNSTLLCVLGKALLKHTLLKTLG